MDEGVKIKQKGESGTVWVHSLSTIPVILEDSLMKI